MGSVMNAVGSHPWAALAGALLAGGFLGGTLPRVAEVLLSLPTLFLMWLKSYFSFNHSLPHPLAF